jgi:outer membrane protein assembly factor BamA
MKPVRLLLLISILTWLSSCSNVRQLADGEQLLVKNRINLKVSEKYGKHRTMGQEMKSLVKQSPNSGTIRFKLWVHTRASRGKLNRFKNWLQEKVGEPPVIYDKQLTAQTTDLLQYYLFNKGYFHAKVTHEEKGKKRVKVTYLVEPGAVYTIDSVHIKDTTSHIGKTIEQYAPESLLKRGEPYDLSVIRSERERINRLIRNIGYYYFNKEYIFFDADSAGSSKQVDLHVRIEEPSDGKHRPHYIKDVYILPDYSKTNKAVDTFLFDGIRFISEGMPYNRIVLLDAIFLKPGDRYSQDDYDRTLSRLIDLGVFKFVNIRFIPRKDKPHEMDAYLYLVAAKKNEISVEGELNTNTSTTTDYPLGTAINLAYKTKNLFRNADLFTVNLQGAAEMQFGEDNLFNTIDITPQLNVNFPRLIPFRFKRQTQSTNPRTRLSLSYNFLQRQGNEAYAINLTNFSYNFDWNEVKGRRHIFSFPVVSQVNLNEASTSQAFIDRLEEEPLLRNRFEEQFIIGATYSFIYNNQKLESFRDYILFRGNFDASGFMPFQELFPSVKFSQFIRIDGDLRYNQMFNKDHRIVYRLAAGVGVPWGQSNVLPYVKQFFIGGANSVRAWRIRDLGPGSFNDSTNTAFPDQTADLRVEGNVEYRFGIVGLLKGAVFLDAGNMWTLEEDTLRPGAKLSATFTDEIAIGAGIGLRMDFTYFIIRFDLAMPLRDPALPTSEKWLLDKVDLSSRRWRNDNLLLNLAIGYPF